MRGGRPAWDRSISRPLVGARQGSDRLHRHLPIRRRVPSSGCTARTRQRSPRPTTPPTTPGVSRRPRRTMDRSGTINNRERRTRSQRTGSLCQLTRDTAMRRHTTRRGTELPMGPPPHPTVHTSPPQAGSQTALHPTPMAPRNRTASHPTPMAPQNRTAPHPTPMARHLGRRDRRARPMVFPTPTARPLTHRRTAMRMAAPNKPPRHRVRLRTVFHKTSGRPERTSRQTRSMATLLIAPRHHRKPTTHRTGT